MNGRGKAKREECALGSGNDPSSAVLELWLVLQGLSFYMATSAVFWQEGDGCAISALGPGADDALADLS